MGTGRGAALRNLSAALGWGRPKGGRWSGRAGGDGMGPRLRLVTGVRGGPSGRGEWARTPRQRRP